MQRKIHNQTLFVAALSVYLGLLIAGAPPQVLAQTIRTDQSVEDYFRIKQKEYDEEKVAALDISGTVESLLSYLKTLRTSDDDAEFHQIFFATSVLTRQQGCIGDWLWRKKEAEATLLPALIKHIEKLDGSVANSLSCFQRYCFSLTRSHEIDVNLNNSDLEIQIAVNRQSPAEAQNFAEKVNEIYLTFSSNSANETKRQIYSHTRVFAYFDQVVIVTRLPRAGLDTLLKANEKAN